MRFIGIQSIDELIKIADSTVTLGRFTPAGSSFFVGPWQLESRSPMTYLYSEKKPAIYAATLDSPKQWYEILHPIFYAEANGTHEGKKYDFYVFEAEKDSFLDIEEWVTGERLVPIDSIKEIHLMLSNVTAEDILKYLEENITK